MSGGLGWPTTLGILAAISVPLASFAHTDPDPNKVTNYSVTNAKQDAYNIPKKEYKTIKVQISDPYLASVASQVGVTLPIVYGSCHSDTVNNEQILGCYYPKSNKIIITQYAAQYGEEHLKCVILHESRHHYQDIKGLMNIEKGVITNRDFLEQDAYNYAGC